MVKSIHNSKSLQSTEEEVKQNIGTAKQQAKVGKVKRMKVEKPSKLPVAERNLAQEQIAKEGAFAGMDLNVSELKKRLQEARDKVLELKSKSLTKSLRKSSVMLQDAIFKEFVFLNIRGEKKVSKLYFRIWNRRPPCWRQSAVLLNCFNTLLNII